MSYDFDWNNIQILDDTEQRHKKEARELALMHVEERDELEKKLALEFEAAEKGQDSSGQIAYTPQSMQYSSPLGKKKKVLASI